MTLVRPISVQGMKELRKALRDMDGESQKEIRVALNQVAAGVAQGAARRVPVRTGKARATLRAMSSQTETRIAAGGKKAPYYGWLDFGGTVGHGRVAGGSKKLAGGATGGHAGATKRPWFPGGRYIYPTIAANRDSLAKAVEKQLVELARSKGLEVS
jgi:hypothetical protein